MPLFSFHVALCYNNSRSTPVLFPYLFADLYRNSSHNRIACELNCTLPSFSPPFFSLFATFRACYYKLSLDTQTMLSREHMNIIFILRIRGGAGMQCRFKISMCQFLCSQGLNTPIYVLRPLCVTFYAQDFVKF